MKRRKDRYNPYKILKIEDKYILEFKNYYNRKQKIEITKEIYDVFDEYELIDISQMNKFDRHIEHSILTENNLNKRKVNKEITVENYVINTIKKQLLYKAISLLPRLQKKRIFLYYFEEFTQKEIAEVEGCSVRAVQYSLNIALKNLKKFFNQTS